MKITNIISVLVLTFILGSCVPMKNASNKVLYNNTWELEYLSGPRIAFNGLFPDKKPTITFNETAKQVTGNSGCNGYTADYVKTGNKISFKANGPTTMMYCGDGETFFTKTMTKVDTYKIDADGKLNLMIGDVSMMRFKKVN